MGHWTVAELDGLVARDRLADLSLELVGGTTESAAEYTRWFVGFVDGLREAVPGAAR